MTLTAPRRSDLADLQARYLAAQLRGDRREAVRVVVADGLDRGVSLDELIEHVVGSAQREIGRLWERNELGVADEHMATAISNLVLAQLYERAAAAERNGKEVVVACVEGELHDLPARLVADALDVAGFDVRFLGANVPTDALLAVLAARRPDLVALSATMSFHSGSVRDAVSRIRAEHGGAIAIAVGGAACDWDGVLVADLQPDLTAESARELVARARRLLGVES